MTKAGAQLSSLRAYLQTPQQFLSGEWLHRYQGRTEFVHFKDYRLNADGEEELFSGGAGTGRLEPRGQSL